MGRKPGAVCRRPQTVIFNYLRDTGEHFPDLCWIVFMIGSTKSRAQPTVVFHGGTTRIRNRAVDIVKHSDFMSRYEDFKVRALANPPNVPNHQPYSNKTPLVPSDLSLKFTLDTIQKEGSSRNRPHGFGLFENTNERIATAGGILSDGSNLYFLTTRHAFEVPPTRPVMDFYSDEDELVYGWDDFDDFTFIGPDSDSDTESERAGPKIERLRSVDVRSNVDEETEPTTPGSEPFTFDNNLQRIPVAAENARLISLGPTLIPQSSFFANALDYALVTFPTDAIDELLNSLDKFGPFPTETYMTRAKASFKNVVVHISPSETITGHLEEATTQKMIGSKDDPKTQDLWTVRLDKRIRKGHSGSWVLCAETSTPIGHIVEGSQDGFQAYIVPFTQIIQDLRLRFSAELKLATAGDIVKLGSYVFEPIPNDGGLRMRVLSFDPSENDEAPLTGHLSIRQEGIAYEALSWAWGSSPELSSILLNDESCRGSRRRFTITKTLQGALKALRLKNSQRRLWIDSICIDQTNLDEKNYQVSLMAQIFGEAERVCVWLGEEADESNLAIKFIQNNLLDLSRFDDLTLPHSKQSTIGEWKALTYLLNRPWFHRRWVLQEIALAKEATLYCGNDQFTWLQLCLAASLLRSKATELARPVKDFTESRYRPHVVGDINTMGAIRLVNATSNLSRRNEFGGISKRLLSLEHLVVTLADLQVSYPHDAVYALLALGKDTWHRTPLPSRSVNETGEETQSSSYASDLPSATPNPHTPVDVTEHDFTSLIAGQKRKRELSSHEKELTRKVVKVFRIEKDPKNTQLFKIDYEQSFFDVCKHFMTFAISKSESLDILCRPWAPEQTKEQLPSWIPTMSKAVHKTKQFGGCEIMKVRTNADLLVGIKPSERPRYRASGSTSAAWKSGEEAGEERSFFVKGFVLDTVKEITDPAWYGNVPEDWLQLYPQRPGLDTVKHDVFWKTLVADRAPDGQNVPIYYALAWQWALDLSPEGCNTGQLLQESSNTILSEFLERVQAVIWKRRMIEVTNTNEFLGSGRVIGLAPGGIRIGDIIAIISGCSVPVVLHPVQDNRYSLVGEAYIHGYMDGEALVVQEMINSGEHPASSDQLREQMNTTWFGLI